MHAELRDEIGFEIAESLSVQVCDGRDYLENGCSGANSEATLDRICLRKVMRGRGIRGCAA